MQSSAKDLTENTDQTAVIDNAAVAAMENRTSLFSSDEIIFKDENNDKPHTRYGYKIAEMNFLIPEGIDSEVIQNPTIFNLPNSPSWIAGLINIRGSIIPVMDLDKFLSKNATKKYSNILVLNKADKKSTISIMVNDLPVSLECNDSTATAKSYPELLLDFIADGFSQKNNDWIEFNPQKLFEKLAGKVNT